MDSGLPYSDQFGISGSQIGEIQTQFFQNKIEFDKIKNLIWKLLHSFRVKNFTKLILHFVKTSFISEKMSFSFAILNSACAKIDLKKVEDRGFLPSNFP